MNLSNFEPYKFKLTHHILKKPYEWSSFPCVLQIDISNYCGLKYSHINCAYCYPQHKIACGEWKYHEMPMEQIAWLLKQIGEYGKNMWYYTLFLNGDGLTDPRLPTILKMGKKYAPNTRNQTFTCGTQCQNAEWLCDSNLDWICVTCSASNSETYKRVHCGDQFDNVMRTMRYVTEHRKSNQELEVHFVITQNNFGDMQRWYSFMGREFPEWRRVFSPLVASYDNSPSKRALGNLTLEMEEKAILDVDPNAKFWNTHTTGLRQPCVLWNNGAVTCDGYLLKCCNWADYLQHNYGNVADYMREGYTLKDYWMQRLANKHNNVLCRSCNLKHPQAKHRLNNISVDVRVDA